jgi:sec-independent protein translocase protein TatA
MTVIAQLGIPGGVELLVVLLIAVLLFGANKIPRLARAAGQSIGEFRRGRKELEEELKGDDSGDEDVEAAD